MAQLTADQEIRLRALRMAKEDLPDASTKAGNLERFKQAERYYKLLNGARVNEILDASGNDV